MDDLSVAYRQAEQDRDALICPLLILTGRADRYILEAVAPVIRQSDLEALYSFCDDTKVLIAPLPDIAPCLGAPPVGFFDKEIGRHARIDRALFLHRIASVALAPDRKIEARCLAHDVAVLLIHRISAEHIAVQTALADFVTAVPRIPDVVHDLTSLS